MLFQNVLKIELGKLIRDEIARTQYTLHIYATLHWEVLNGFNKFYLQLYLKSSVTKMCKEYRPYNITHDVV